jgi:hypothetical protein
MRWTRIRKGKTGGCEWMEGRIIREESREA